MKQIDDIFFEDLYNIQVICVYGQGNESFYSFLKEWIKENEERQIIFLEDDKEKYSILKKCIDKDFQNKNIKDFLIEDDLETNLKQIAWNCVYLNLKIVKSSSEKRNERFKNTSDILYELHIGANLTSYLYSDFGIKIFENVYNNLIKTDHFILFEPLHNQFKNIPAIIAGAGPSLDKNIHLLNEAYDKALIFVGGSALNIFSKRNIRFHFAASIDQSHLFKRFKNNYFFENVFFYTNQISHHNLSIVHGNKVLLSDYGAYPLKSWIYNKLSIKQKIFEGGWNVTTFLIKLASFLGCKPIYFVGMDLCYKKNKYAKGVVKSNKKYDLIKVKDINGNITFTQNDWILAKKWIEEFSILNRDKKFINATEGGLKIENVENLKLLDELNNLKQSLDLHGYIHSIYENQKRIKFKKSQVIEILQIIKESFKRSDVICDEYLFELKQNDLDENLMKFQKEVVYIYLLDPMWQIWKYVILRKVEKNKFHILINKLLFFKNVIINHLELLEKII
jgi:hypothetical protein